jgi:hypothetical protein
MPANWWSTGPREGPVAGLSRSPASGRLSGVSEVWTPDLRLDNRTGGCRLTLLGLTYGDGQTLQAAATDLLARLFDVTVAFRAGRYLLSTDLGAPDPRMTRFLWELIDLIAEGGDLRQRIFGVPLARDAAD